MHRLSVLVALLLIGCSARSVTPTLAPISPQVFQKKQPFTNPWLLTHLGVSGAAPSALVAQGKYVWVADRGASELSRVSMRGGSKNFPLNFRPHAIAIGSDNNIWLTSDSGDKIGRVSPTGQETDFTVSGFGSELWDLVNGADGALWFTLLDQNGNGFIGRIDVTGVVTLYPGFGYALVAGPDGNLWFTDYSNFYAMNMQGQIVGTFPSTDGGQYSTVGPDGAMWFSDPNQLVRVTTAGKVTAFQPPVFGPFDIASYGGQLWVTNNSTNGNMLSPFNPATQTWGTPIPSPYTTRRIITGIDGNFWMTGPTGSIVTYVNQVMSVSPTSLSLKSGESGTLTVSETNYSGTWSAVWPSQIVNVVQTSPGVFTVTAIGQGMGKVTIQDTMHNYTKIPVTVQ